MYRLNFCVELENLLAEVTYYNNDSMGMEKSINSFLIDFKSADYGTHKSAFDCLKSKLVSQYQSLGQLVYQRQQTIKERKKQNKSILKITKALTYLGSRSSSISWGKNR